MRVVVLVMFAGGVSLERVTARLGWCTISHDAKPVCAVLTKTTVQPVVIYRREMFMSGPDLCLTSKPTPPIKPPFAIKTFTRRVS